MKHRNTSDIYLYWNRIRGTRPVPDRTEVEPSSIRQLLKDTFILEQRSEDDYGFRLAGTRTCSIFGREMKNRNLLELCQDDTQQALQTILHSTIEDHSVNVVGFVGKNESGRTLAMEVIFLPLKLTDGSAYRILGTISPIKIPFWMGMQPVQSIELSSFRMILPHQHTRELSRMMHRQEDDTVFDLVKERERLMSRNDPTMSDSKTEGRRVRHLVVLDGGVS